jgi:hypothetical protein
MTCNQNYALNGTSCTEVACDTNYKKAASNCGTTGSNGWTLSSTDTQSTNTNCKKCVAKTCSSYSLKTKSEADALGTGYTCSSQTKTLGDDTKGTCYSCSAKTCSSYSLKTKSEADELGDGYDCDAKTKTLGDDTNGTCYDCTAKTCDGYSLTTCPDHGNCDECLSGTTTKYKFNSCETGYTKNSAGTACEAESTSGDPCSKYSGYASTTEYCDGTLDTTSGKWQAVGSTKCYPCTSSSSSTGCPTNYATSASACPSSMRGGGYTVKITTATNGTYNGKPCYKCCKETCTYTLTSMPTSAKNYSTSTADCTTCEGEVRYGILACKAGYYLASSSECKKCVSYNSTTNTCTKN